MDGVAIPTFASVFANNLIIGFAGAICAYIGLNRIFPLRRKPACLFWAYFLVKCALWAFFDTTSFFGAQTEALQIIKIIVVATLSLVTYAILYETWKSSLLKIALAAVLVDSVSGFSSAAAMALASWLGTGAVSLDYAGYLGLKTFGITVLWVLFFLPLIWAVTPVGRFIRDFQFNRERFWTLLLMAVLVLTASFKTEGVDDSIAVYALVALAALLLVAHVLWRGREVQKKRVFLARTQALTRAYSDSLQNEAEFLAESRLLLDDLSSRIGAAGEKATESHLLDHLADLQSTCDNLRFGTYSENPALDAMLISWETRFKALGISVDYRIAPLPKNGGQAALITQSLFEWAHQTLDGASAKQPTADELGKWISLRAFRRANQLLIEMRAPSLCGRRFPRSWVSERMASSTCFVKEFDEDSQKVVRVIAEEEEAPWAS